MMPCANARDPDAALMEFLQSTYAAAADLGKWDRAALECALGEAGNGEGGVAHWSSSTANGSGQGRSEDRLRPVIQ